MDLVLNEPHKLCCTSGNVRSKKIIAQNISSFIHLSGTGRMDSGMNNNILDLKYENQIRSGLYILSTLIFFLIHFSAIPLFLGAPVQDSVNMFIQGRKQHFRPNI